MNNKIFGEISEYYTDKINLHGCSSRGVDWKDENSQLLRLHILLNVISSEDNFTVNDLGCGYGILYEILKKNYGNFIYRGYDLSKAMIDKGITKYGENQNVVFRRIIGLRGVLISDYTVASGIFNVRMKRSTREWKEYVKDTLDYMNTKSRKGFSYNMLTKYSDRELMRANLYYADPCYYFDYCKKNFSRNVSLIHDYNLFEFTILVKK